MNTYRHTHSLCTGVSYRNESNSTRIFGDSMKHRPSVPDAFSHKTHTSARNNPRISWRKFNNDSQNEISIDTYVFFAFLLSRVCSFWRTRATCDDEPDRLPNAKIDQRIVVMRDARGGVCTIYLVLQPTSIGTTDMEDIPLSMPNIACMRNNHSSVSVISISHSA